MKWLINRMLCIIFSKYKAEHTAIVCYECGYMCKDKEFRKREVEAGKEAYEKYVRECM
jgi:hypothetical protein